jgi:hypothetical protein
VNVEDLPPELRTSIALGCWTWTGGISGSGYAYKEGHRLSRWVYEVAYGPVPEGLVIDHLCRNRACIRPDHLEAVTQTENLARGNTMNRVNRSKTACKHGHPYSTENTHVVVNNRYPNGKRVCRPCQRDYMRARRGQTLEG